MTSTMFVQSLPLTLVALFVAGCGAAFLLITLVQAFQRSYRRGLAPEVSQGLRESMPHLDADRVLLACLVGAASLGAIAAAVTGSLLFATAMVVLGSSAPMVSVRLMRRSRRRQFRSQLPDLLMLLAGALRSGAGLQLSLSRVAGAVAAPASRELERVLQAVRMGTPLAQALHGLERRMPIEEVTLWVTAMRLGSESGGGTAAVLESLSEAMRRKLVLERKILALTAQGRLQSWVMSALPMIVLALLSLVDAQSFSRLVDTPDGRWILGAVAVGQILGFLHIRRIVAIEI